MTQALAFPWARDDIDSQPHAHRRIAIGIGLSLLLHGLLLLVVVPKPTIGELALNQPTRGPLVVRLLRARPAPPTPPAPPTTPAPQAPVATPALPAPQPVPKQSPPRRRPPVLAVPKPTQRPPAVVEPPPTASTPAPPKPAPPMDFMAMVNAKRRASEEAAVRANAEARANGREPSADEIATANINRNLHTVPREGAGTSGVFQILSKGTRTGQFSFRGWTTDPNHDYRQLIDVDAGLGGDIDLAIVRKMIELIRTHYQGNFNWESHRLGEVIVLSARKEDNAELEAFLMREFFGRDG